jgi:hypothetical protein
VSKIRAANLSVCRIHSTPTSLAAVGLLKVPGISKSDKPLEKRRKNYRYTKTCSSLSEHEKRIKGKRNKRIKTKKNQVSKVWKDL